MNECFNVYCSEWLYGFGRFVIVTSSQYGANRQDITSEAFVFAFDTAPDVKRFSARAVNYKANPETHDKVKIDLTFMEHEAQQQARNLIYEYQYEEYNKSKDRDLMNRAFKFSLCERDTLISLKINGAYETELKYIMEKTKCDDLRKYMSIVLSLPKLEIRDI